MHLDPASASLGPRLEKAQCQLNRAIGLAAARAHPERGAQSLEVGSGFASFLGRGSPFNQALCLALEGPISSAELDAVESLLGQEGAEGAWCRNRVQSV